MSTTFNVYSNTDLAGVLTVDEQMRMSFHYHTDYIAQAGKVISLTLPLTDSLYGDAVIFPFVENLLPEGEIRDKLQSLHKIEDGNYERLLEILGGDVAGAISFYPEGQSPLTKPADDDGQALTSKEISQLLLDIQDRPFSSTTDKRVGNRLSLAGAQNKLPIIKKENDIFEAGQEPSTHIVKPARKDGRFPSIVYNEYICMRAAKRAKLSVAEVSLLAVHDEEGNESDALLIERYDRYVKAGITYRLPQEDLCQLNSIVSTRKYQMSGGPGFIELFNAIKTYSHIPALDDLEAIKRMVFNLVIGNYDAHGKNYSFLTDQQERIRLSPAYDLVCTQAYDELDTTFAMNIDGVYELPDLTENHFQNLFEAIDKKYSGLKKQIVSFIHSSLAAIEAEVRDFEGGDFYEEDLKMARMLLAIAKDNSRTLLECLNVNVQ